MRYISLLAFVTLGTLLAADQPDSNADRTAAWNILDHSLQNGSSTEHREQALAALSTFGSNDPGAVQRADAALHDSNAMIRQSAALALGALQAHSAVADLKRALDDTPEVSFAAAKALTALGDTSGRDVLIAVLTGERKDTPGILTNAKRAAENKLKHPGGLLLMGSEDAAGSLFGPASMIIPAVTDTADLKSKGAPGRAAAVAYLAKYPDPYAIQLLEWALKDDNQFVRLEAAKALGERGDAGSIEKLRPVLNDDHNIVRDMAAISMLRILAREGQPGAVTPGPVDQPKTTKK